ncbi:MAG: DMT family transporter [Hyphomicrobiales bacterium]|nr:DMT family transporter [Hyphomicrobiales bacterium]
MSRNSDLGGIVAMLAGTASFVVGDSFMKVVIGDLPPFEVLFLRGVAAILACGVLLLLTGDWRAVGGVRDRRALLRAGAETVATLCYILALARLPIADAIAILQIAPLLVILGAGLLFRERIGRARLALVLAGFAGAVMVAQPGPAGVSSAALFAFASALLAAVCDLLGRGVPARIPVMIVTFATNVMLMSGAGGLSLVLEPRTAPTGQNLAFLGLAGLFVTLGHIGLLRAYRIGRTAAVAPFFYSFALWAMLAGLIVWGALPSALALVGIALIIGSGAAIVALDQRRGGDEVAREGAV